MSHPFESLQAPIAESLQKRGFTQLTPVQESVLSEDSQGVDLRISSQTGSGKTVAIGLVLARDWAGMESKPRAEGVDSRVARPKVALIAPTRELANQVAKELGWLLAPLGVKVACVTGGTNLGGDRRLLQGFTGVLVGTPGRVCDHLRGGRIELSQLHTLVLDEADQMLDLGFRDELDAIIAAAPAERLTHFVSATFRNEVGRLADRFQKNARVIQGTPLGKANSDIEHVVHVIRDSDMEPTIINLLLCAGQSRTLIFCRTRADVGNLAERLTRLGFGAAAISGDLAQAQRERALAAFQSGVIRVLIATDVASRGIHVENIELVIQAEAPKDPEVYVHRSGRTGRAGNKGRSVLLVPDRWRRRVERMLSDARITPKYLPVPSRAQVTEIQDARAIEALAEPTQVSDRFANLAKKLCATGNPEQVLATLLARSTVFGPCEGFEVAAPAPPPQQRRDAPVRRELPRGNARDDARESGRPGPGQGGPRPSHAAGQFVPFFVSCGQRQGATTARLLSMACRRGGIKSDAIGAIQVGERSSVVEVHADFASAFAQLASQPDARDPNIRITPVAANSSRHPAAAFKRGRTDDADSGEAPAPRKHKPFADANSAPPARKPFTDADSALPARKPFTDADSALPARKPFTDADSAPRTRNAFAARKPVMTATKFTSKRAVDAQGQDPQKPNLPPDGPGGTSPKRRSPANKTEANRKEMGKARKKERKATKRAEKPEKPRTSNIHAA
ncbi:MAG: High confidence in function and specificity [Pseudomonadota bacterium]|jgi:ATP-dependent RNA helicase DeaD